MAKRKNRDLSQALALFHKTVKSVSAYGLFLKKHKIDPSKIKTEANFKTLPFMDRSRYLKAYPLKKLVPDGVIPPMISMSSGSSGKPFYWPRHFRQEERGGRMHENIFSRIFGIKKRDSTLVIICFSMGTWIAGTFTLASCQWVARRGYNLSVTTPGIEINDTLSILRDLAPNFRNVIMAGYPPFLMDVIHAARTEKINLKRLNLFLLSAGEGFSEKWRATAMKLAGMPRSLNRVISIYGSADADALAHETPLTVFLRQESDKNKKLRLRLFDGSSQAGLVQYYPQDRYFEEVSGYLIFTTDAGIPLVRYKIGDSGRVLPFAKVLEILKANGLYQKAKALLSWNLPFVLLGRRADVSVSFYALNIYFDNFKSALEDYQISKSVTGKFLASSKISGSQRDQKLVITIELSPKIKPTARLSAKIQRVIFENLLLLNIEYRKLYSSIGKKAMPAVKLLAHGDPSFQIKKAKLNFRRA